MSKLPFKQLQKGQYCEYSGKIYMKVSKVMKNCCIVDYNAIEVFGENNAYIQERQEVTLLEGLYDGEEDDSEV